MNKLYNSSGVLLTKHSDFIPETEIHFKTLYSKRPVERIDLDNLLNNNIKIWAKLKKSSLKSKLSVALTETEMLLSFWKNKKICPWK